MFSDMTIRQIVDKLEIQQSEIDNMTLKLFIRDKYIEELENRIKDLKRINAIYRQHLPKNDKWIR